MLWLNKKDISQLASDIEIHPAYIEKDLHLIKIMQIAKTLDTEQHKFVFTGGTSLSKGYKLTNRFSEDVDLNVNADMAKSARSKLRDNLIAAIENNDYTVNNLIKANESRFFAFEIEYPKIFDTPTQLRQNLKIEVAYNVPRLEPEIKLVESFFYQYDNTAPAVEMPCLSLTEIAANKINALLWRTNSTKGLKDRALTRHLYDLSKMKPHIMNENLVKLTQETFETDKMRGDSVLNYNTALSMAVERLQDKPFANDYAVFVDRMVYNNADKIPYDKVLNDFKDLTKFVEL